jgi:hypothetical protein
MQEDNNQVNSSLTKEQAEIILGIICLILTFCFPFQMAIIISLYFYFDGMVGLVLLTVKKDELANAPEEMEQQLASIKKNSIIKTIAGLCVFIYTVDQVFKYYG